MEKIKILFITVIYLDRKRFKYIIFLVRRTGNQYIFNSLYLYVRNMFLRIKPLDFSFMLATA